MSKLKNFIGFTDKYKEVLNLSISQINQIDDAEYEFYKDEHWNNHPKGVGRKEIYEMKIFCFLTDDQIKSFKEHLKNKKSIQQKKSKEKLKKTTEVQTIRLADLKLSEDQLNKYVKMKINWLQLKTKKMKMANSLEELNHDFIQQNIYDEHIYPIFNDEQLKKYKKIVEAEESKTNAEKDKWVVKHEKVMFKRRYNINLTDEQSVKIFSKDFNINFTDSEGQILSDFEMKEIQRDWYKENLNEDQFKIYEPHFNEEVNNIIKSIEKSNNGHHLIQLKRNQAFLVYYLENVLPHLIHLRKRIDKKLNDAQKNLITIIRSYYFNKLEVARLEFIQQHYRYCKDYNPNALEENLVRNKIDKVQINILFLYGYSPTKELMNEVNQALVLKELNKLKSVFDKLKQFRIESYESTGGNYGGGWHFKIPIKKGEEHLENIGLLLLNPDLESNLEKIEMR